ncbi:peptidase domain-containing ABC transporter [Fulvivirga imtechensis]|uniref:peptidase domain-containing ABC transporter n=1 Tax=Fulvivirga imtechensis TaxID=881893 RepID=UPI001FE2312E|nr:ABC transporter transmembrane domain-containing protein [Fulvivirga imtechensis]
MVKEGTIRQQYKEAQKNKRQWILSLVKKDSNLLLAALFIGVIVAVLGLSTAVFSQKLIDVIIPNKEYTKLITGLILLGFLLIGRSALSYLRQYFLIRQGRDFNVRLVDGFFGKLLQLPVPFFHSRKTGDLIARMNDSQRIQQVIIYLTSSLMIDILMLLISVGGVFFYSQLIGFFILAVVPMYGFIIYKYHHKIVKAQKEVMQAYSINESHYVDTIQGIEEIKLHNKEATFSKATKNIYGHFQQKIYDLGKVKIGFSTLSELVASIFIVSVLGWSAWLVLEQSITTGALIAILQMTGIILPSAGNLALTNLHLQEARIAIDRLFEYSSVEPESGETSTRQETNSFEALEVKDIAFRFPGRSLLFSGVSFQVRKGENIAILGESGSGKTTILHLIKKFYEHESGQILANGIPLTSISNEAWRKKLGVVSQEIKIFNGTVLDNVMMGTPVDKAEQYIEYLNKTGLTPLIAKFPQGYATIIGEDGIRLSGGQRQILALARALCKRPDILLLDEATSAMDRDTEIKVRDILNSIKKHFAIITLTHRVNLARYADRIYLLENKTISSSGNHEDLMITDNLYSRGWKDLIPELEVLVLSSFDN